MIYRVESRNKLDGSQWKFVVNTVEPIDYLLSRYKDNHIVEFRIKSFRRWNTEVSS